LVLDRSTPVSLKADQICNLALQRRLPSMGFDRRFPDAGCLMSYSEDFLDMIRRAAGIVDKILKGAKPADLPGELATKYELIINLRADRAPGGPSPPLPLARADKVIRCSRAALLLPPSGAASLPRRSPRRSKRGRSTGSG